MKHHISLLLALLVSLAATAQEYPKDYFKPPLKLTTSFSGSFAELRNNHFHSGLDLRIGGKVGAPVYAAADGYVSRIAISSWGGGKVLYITHPNGYKTVYMHLNDFAGDIGKWVRDYQYEHHVYAFDENLPVGAVQVKQGQLVAHAGNTGASGGPHLHYEIRQADNDRTINPLLFGLPFTDPIAPTIRGIRIYPSDKSTSIAGSNQPLQLAASRDTITIGGSFYLGIYTTDVSEQSYGKNGIDLIELYVDGNRFFRYQNRDFLFEETRVANAIVDYALYQRTREQYVLTRKLAGMRCRQLDAPVNNGHLCFNDGQPHKIEYRVSDFAGNTTKRQFTILPGTTLPTADPRLEDLTAKGDPVVYHKPYGLQRPQFRVDIDEYTIYDNDYLLYTTRSDSRYLSQVHTLSLYNNPLPPHRTYHIAIRDNSGDAKRLIVQLSGNKATACATTRDGQWLTAPVRAFGSFAVSRDDVAPVIKAVNFGSGKRPKGNTLRIKITDNLAGLDSYHCYINGKWVLGEYDGKSSTLYVGISGQLRPSGNTIRVIATDACQNKSEAEWRF